MTPACRALLHRGYVVLESVYHQAELCEIRQILEQAWRQAGSPGGGGLFGHIMHPLFRWAPAMRAFYDRPRVTDLLAELFGEPPRLAHNGALWSDRSRRFTSWHYHRTDSEDSARVWDLQRSQCQPRISRVLANCYVDGSTPEMGELLVYPRAVDDPLAPPELEPEREWQGQAVVHCPPGSVVVFDQSLFHAARASRIASPRRIFGGHYTGMSERELHREDNES